MKTLSTTLFVFACAALSACGGDSSSGDDVDDPDAADAASVVSVACAGATIAETVTTSGAAYSPQATTISVGEIVHFTPAGTHDVNGDDPDFTVPLGGDACFRFDVAGSYPFHCTPHGFTGTITVQ